MGGNKKKRKVSDAVSVGEAPTDKAIHDIDAIFSSRKKKNEDREGELASAGQALKSSEKTSSRNVGRKRKKKNVSADDSAGDGGLNTQVQPKSKRKTQEGFMVYTEEELGWHKKNAGGTALCPFDCECCF